MLTKRWSPSESVQLLLPPTSTTCNIYNSNHPSIPLSTHPSINVAIYPSSHPSIFIHPAIPPSINIPIHASIHRSIHIPIHPSISRSIHPYPNPSIHIDWSLLPLRSSGSSPATDLPHWEASTDENWSQHTEGTNLNRQQKNGLTDVSVYYNVVWCCAYLNGQQRHCFRDYYT